jgi:hypothetical protein
MYPFKLLIIMMMVLNDSNVFAQAEEWGEWYDLKVLPPEHRQEKDEKTGANLLYITSNPAKDINLYYHQRSWISNSSAILFYSSRDETRLMAYYIKTGELLYLNGPDGKPLIRVTAAVHRNTVFTIWNNMAIEFEFKVNSANGEKKKSNAQGRIRKIAPLKPSERHFDLNESCDGRFLAYGTIGYGLQGGPQIFLIDIETGQQRELINLPPDRGVAAHVQWSRTDPYLLSFSSRMEPHPFRAGPRRESKGRSDYLGRCQRLWVVDIRTGEYKNVYRAIEGELVTHAIWWVNNSIIFTGATALPTGKDWSHVKVLDVESGDVRIIGAGSWWPDATEEEMSRLNWWHPSGSDNGHWVVSDNWHGDIMLFEGRSSRQHLLTGDHRTYGGGDHPHPGWDRKGNQVIFTSHRLGSEDVCVATIPAPLQELVESNTDGIGNLALHHKIVPQGERIFMENFNDLNQWHLEGHTGGVSLVEGGWLRLDCSGSQQGGVGVHAFLRKDMPDNICLEYDLFTEEKNGLLLTFLGLKGIDGEDGITGVPKREGRFIDYTGKEASTKSYHISLSRYNDEGIHTGVSNWRRNPGLNLVGQGKDPCEKIGRIYRVAIIKQGRLCQLQVDGKVISGFIDDAEDENLIPKDGKIGFRAIGAHAVVRIGNFKVTALD